MEFATLHLDTYKVVKLLQEKGYTEAEAEGFIQAVQEITLSGVATKQDVSELRQFITDTKYELEEKIAKVASDALKFQLVQTITIVAVMLALFQLFS